MSTIDQHQPNDVASQKDLFTELKGGFAPADRLAIHRAEKSGKIHRVPGPKPKDVYYKRAEFREWISTTKYAKHLSPEGAKLPDGASEEMATYPLPPSTDVDDVAAPGEIPELAALPEATVLDFEVDDRRYPVPVGENPALLAEITEAENLKASLSNLSAEQIIETATTHAARAVVFATSMMNTGKCLLVAAWECGTVLTHLKATIGHGKFGRVLGEVATANRTCVRTFHRYMKLAGLAPDIRPLLESCNNLRMAYAALGIAGVQPDEEPVPDNGDSQEEPVKTAGGTDSGCTSSKVLASASTLQKHLRQFKQAGKQLNVDDIRQLKLILNEVLEFANQQDAIHLSPDDAA